ncbi:MULTISPECIES: MocR-like pyridoxine biosynthesis transcription factor PdxR [unclassified Corallococcus]|uniref:MocR-like pyridoxine biosynthesis transcription factor PdxR n=1 Tax=unclassified Corallococcus TaxID=2685029 RepID=UPI001A8D735C|nr:MULTISPECIES: PLP-dependent aminotransferase family protein [unclassified Corallococcus]MBN9682296.1 PLP-dependent aminotransferase family protein [Corallococcus sp. NCSPR001]WAS86148.1 PLP-dependent aminotransferase family protein [Corallococcus sp. NCRR]
MKTSTGVASSLLLRLDSRSPTPLHEQLFEGIRARILAGALAPGLRLPSSRQLATELDVARSTVLQALDALTAEGYLVARAGSCTRVAPALPILAGDRIREPGLPVATRAPSSDARDPRSRLAATRASGSGARGPRLAASARALKASPVGAPRLGAAPRAFRPGVPALDLFPTALWARTVSRVHARASTGLLDGGDPSGHAPLRDAIATHVSVSRGVRCSPAQVFITAGTQQAFDEVLRLALDPGDSVWVEDPGYPGVRRAVLSAGGRPVPIPVDGDGLDVSAGLARAPRARVALVAPSHQYPLGVTLSLARRMALLQWAERTRSLIIEDDYDSEFRHRGRPLTALQGLDDSGCVVYVGTFSKSMFPGLRLGFLVVPPSLVEVFSAARAAASAPASSLEQAALAAFLAEGHFARHLRRMRAAYRERGEALLEALRADCPGVLTPRPCDTGMQVCASLAASLSDLRVRDEAARKGVEVAALSGYFLGRRRESGLVFGFGGVRPDDMRAGTRALARAIEAARRNDLRPSPPHPKGSPR